MKIEYKGKTVDVSEKYAKSLISRNKAKAVKPGRKSKDEAKTGAETKTESK